MTKRKDSSVARRLGPGSYRIGPVSVRKRGEVWHAFAAGRDAEPYSKWFTTLAAAHLELTGSPIRAEAKR